MAGGIVLVARLPRMPARAASRLARTVSSIVTDRRGDDRGCIDLSSHRTIHNDTLLLVVEMISVLEYTTSQTSSYRSAFRSCKSRSKACSWASCCFHCVKSPICQRQRKSAAQALVVYITVSSRYIGFRLEVSH